MTETAPSQLPLPIDRRPVRVIECWNENPNDPLGRAPWWAVEDAAMAVTNLCDHLSVHYVQGYRRFLLSLPAGHPHGQHLMSSSQWLTMTPERREQLMDMLPAWKVDYPDAELYVYAGFNVADPASLHMPEPIVVPDITRDWAWFATNWREWIEECGIDGIGFDYTGLMLNRWAFVEVARALSIAGIKCIGEATPTVRPAYGHGTSAEVYLAPWFALDQYIHQRDPEGRWRFDPHTTECGVGLRRSMLIAGNPIRLRVTEPMIRDWVRRGLIPYVYTTWDDLVMQLERDRRATDPDTPAPMET